MAEGGVRREELESAWNPSTWDQCDTSDTPDEDNESFSLSQKMAGCHVNVTDKWITIYSRTPLIPIESLSTSIDVCMTLLGYSDKIRRARIEACKQHDCCMTAARKGVLTCLTTGSKADGLTCSFESDRDEMRILDGVVCVEEGVDSKSIPKETTVLRLNNRMSYPGHGVLLLDKNVQTIHPFLKKSLDYLPSGNAILSSDLFVKAYPKGKPEGAVRHDRAGPSMPMTCRGVVHIDTVYTIRCICPSILNKWAERSRIWPPPDVVQKVKSLGAFMSPVGFKGSRHKQIEWRICFNEGETELVSNLNETQAKIYVMLKMIVKDVLQPCNKEITSYALKNIVLWLAERNPQHSFHDRTLWDWLRKSLYILRMAIDGRQLPYYMIPDRNLMEACGLEDAQQTAWVNMITEMIKEGPRMILRLKKMRTILRSNLDTVFWFYNMRTELEILNLELTSRHERGAASQEDNEKTAEQMKRVNEILVEVRERSLVNGNRVDDRREIFDLVLGDMANVKLFV
ncbi:uncharacterized protein LOC127867872 [Dreissena polymorpha]|uniref:Uncharacterized protein n=1 Tax=Dreissena polymorpha TaxID=45954 RepID=A0A9D4M366_DREPO|nr:uncharacterized protein LOC127867872 [Dreissena polymorpha]XP_052265339.1 uncharacterized protein LOC127867872 [Dreissena polymorpha]KAH3868746.1 hypothetical protein DPMN_031898 [Dreissena polymorpha]